MKYDVIKITTYDIPPAGLDIGYAEWREENKDNVLMQIKSDHVIISYKENIAGDYTHYTFLVISKNGEYDNFDAAKLAFEVS